MLCYTKSHHVTSCYVTSYHITSQHVMLCQNNVILHHSMPYSISFYITMCHILYHITSQYVMLCHAMSYCSTTRHIISYHVMSHQIILQSLCIIPCYQGMFIKPTSYVTACLLSHTMLCNSMSF